MGWCFDRVPLDEHQLSPALERGFSFLGARMARLNDVTYVVRNFRWSATHTADEIIKMMEADLDPLELQDLRRRLIRNRSGSFSAKGWQIAWKA